MAVTRQDVFEFQNGMFERAIDSLVLRNYANQPLLINLLETGVPERFWPENINRFFEETYKDWRFEQQEPSRYAYLIHYRGNSADSQTEGDIAA
jgi:hypothetical protein